MKEKSYALLALNAMRRASILAKSKAAEKNLKIPVWQDGKISYMDPITSKATGSKATHP